MRLVPTIGQDVLLPGARQAGDRDDDGVCPRQGACVVRQTFIIHGRLPGLNEIIDACRSNRYEAASQKRATEADVAWAIRAFSLKPVTGSVWVTCRWYEATSRRDPDNVFAGVKFILDALVTAGVLEGDGQRHIAGITHELAHDRLHPRVEVTLEGGEHERAAHQRGFDGTHARAGRLPACRTSEGKRS